MSEQVKTVTLWRREGSFWRQSPDPQPAQLPSDVETTLAFIPSEGIHLVPLTEETVKEISEASCEEDDGWWKKGHEPHCGVCLVCVLRTALEEGG